MGVAQQQLVEIAKALSQDARVLIMDEPTAALSENEIEMLFEVIRDLKKHGVAIIYISHRLQELEQIGDRVTILRDGQTISTHNIDEITLDEIVRRMVGRKVSRERVRLVNTRTGEVALEAKNIVRKGVLNDISCRSARARSWLWPVWSARAARSWPTQSSVLIRSTPARSAFTANASRA